MLNLTPETPEVRVPHVYSYLGRCSPEGVNILRQRRNEKIGCPLAEPQTEVFLVRIKPVHIADY